MPLSDNRLNQINCIKIIIILSRLVLSSKFWLIGEWSIEIKRYIMPICTETSLIQTSAFYLMAIFRLIR